MKKSYLAAIALLSALSIFFVSCSIDSDPGYTPPEELFGTDYLDFYDVPSIMYQVNFANQKTRTMDGFLIDNKGQIHTFEDVELSFDYRNFSEVGAIKVTEIDKMLANSKKTSETVEIHTAVEFFKKVIRTNSQPMEQLEGTTNNEDVTTTFYAYSHHYRSNGCDVRRTNQLLTQIPLRSEGTEIWKHKSHVSKEIVEWLANFNVYSEVEDLN